MYNFFKIQCDRKIVKVIIQSKKEEERMESLTHIARSSYINDGRTASCIYVGGVFNLVIAGFWKTFPNQSQHSNTECKPS